jgi:hypothetical protein
MHWFLDRVLVVCVSCALACAALAQTPTTAIANLAPNPSFEDGPGAPLGWVRGTCGFRPRGPARTGHYSIGAVSHKPLRQADTWRSDAIPLEPRQSYRLDGWIKCRSGEAVTGLDLLDAQGRVISTACTPSVSPGRGWQFTAVEADVPKECAAGRIWLRVSGEAYLDDVVLAPMVRNLMFNPTFDVDSKGRVAFWSDEPQNVLGGARAGSQRGDSSVGRTGSSLLIEAPEGWFAARAVDMPLPEGVTTFRFSGWARAGRGEVFAWIAWLDAWGKVARLDRVGGGESENGWTHHEAANLRPPSGATHARVVVAVRNGKAWFDDFWFSWQQPARNTQPVVHVHVNQVGYELEGPKSLVVATNFFPTNANLASIEFTPSAGTRPLPLRCSGRIHDGTPDDWGAYYWRADFSALRQPGVYRALARVGGVQGESFPFEIGRNVLVRRTADLAVRFFFVQRCGFDVPGWHKACHLDDANLADGKHIDATGGWHSAGDYNKIMYENGDGGCAFAMLAAYGAAPARFLRYDRDRDGTPDVVEETLWGAQFVAKMQNPETGGLYNTVGQGPGRAWMKWSPPELHTDNIVGTADDPVIEPGEGHSPLVIGAWARLSAMLRKSAVKNDYLERAIRLFNHATAGAAETTSPHLLLSALELHDVTGDQRYLEFARRSAEATLATQTTSGRMRGAFGTYGEVSAAALAVFALAHPQEPVSARIREVLRIYRLFCETTNDNPFGLSKQRVGDEDYFFEPTSTLGHNFELLARAWAAALIARLNGDGRALRYAADQVDWVFGKNPIGLCMFEGAGSFNPPRYHHRYDSIPGHERGAVPGAIPNGFVRSAYGLDQPGFDLSRVGSERPHPSYRTSEPWLVHNLFYLLALSALSSSN